MSETSGIGLEAVTAESTPILHARISGRSSFGRVSDLIAMWLKNEYQFDFKLCGEIRVLMHGLVELAFSHDQENFGQLELAVDQGQVYLSIRTQNFIIDQTKDIEKQLVQYWMNSDDCSLIKKVLFPHDRVEVRFSSKLSMLEWRTIRPLSSDSLNLEDVSFKVFVDSDLSGMNHYQYVEMGDLPFQEWMKEIYSNSHEKEKSGDLVINGESVRDENEWARVVAQREEFGIEEEARFAADAQTKDASKMVIAGLSDSSTQEQGLVGNRKFDAHEFATLQEKVNRFSQLLFQKDKKIEKLNLDLEQLQKNIESIRDSEIQGENNLVRSYKEKALQMYDMAKSLQIEKNNLEKIILDMKKDVSGSQGGSVSAPNATLIAQYDETNKKLDRMNRALESEKQKVKSLLDRALLAEKEAQSTGPLVVELERKVETALRMADQYKKESEKLKQKLVQSDAETNKVKNELMKSQAQVQTLMKRNAA